MKDEQKWRALARVLQDSPDDVELLRVALWVEDVRDIPGRLRKLPDVTLRVVALCTMFAIDEVLPPPGRKDDRR